MRRIIPVLALMTAACGPKPPAHIPVGVTIDDVLHALDNRSRTIRDLSGSATIKLHQGRQLQTFSIQFRYVYPDSFRVFVKGFAGSDLTRITVLGDSMVMYIPSENAFIAAGTDDRVLKTLAPDMDFDERCFGYLFTGFLPPGNVIKNCTVSLDHYGTWIDLLMTDERPIYRCRVEGRDMKPVYEELTDNRGISWKRTVTWEYAAVKSLVPSQVVIEHGENRLEVTFSGCEANRGITGGDLGFVIPPSAERWTIVPENNH